MRYKPEQKAETRQRIVAAAARVFRRQGFGAGSVDDCMSEAGLTAGGFYAHFKSKDELFAAALLDTLRRGRVLAGAEESEPSPGEQAGTRASAMAGKYLSPAHRKLVSQGCPLPPLLAELPRQSAALRRELQDFLQTSLARLEPSASPPAAPAAKDAPPEVPPRAWAFLALLVGGMSLARAVDDEGLADRILTVCREQAEALYAEPAAPAATASRRASTSVRSKRKPRT